MRKIIILILALALFYFGGWYNKDFWIGTKIPDANARMTLMQLAGYSYSAAGGTDWSNVTLYWGFENNSTTVLDTSCGDGYCDHSDGDTSASDYGSPAIEGTTVKVGSYSIYYQRASLSEASSFSNSAAEDLIAGSEGRIGFWVYLEATDEAQEFLEIRIDSSNRIAIRQDGVSGNDWSVEFALVDGGTTKYFSHASTLTISTWYWVEIWWKASTNQRGIRVYNSSLTEIGSEATDSTTFNDLDMSSEILYIGNRYEGDTDEGFYIDNFMISSDSTDDLSQLANTDGYNE